MNTPDEHSSPTDTRDAVMEFVQREFVSNDAHGMPGLDDPLLSSAGGVVDSMGLQQLIVFIEDGCGIHIDDTEILPENFETLGSLCAFLESKKRLA